MQKAKVTRDARRTTDERSRQLLSAIEGQAAELCRELAVTAKRMRQLQEQAEELRTAVCQWVGQSERALGPPRD